jgi:hypothetical protein
MKQLNTLVLHAANLNDGVVPGMCTDIEKKNYYPSPLVILEQPCTMHDFFELLLGLFSLLQSFAAVTSSPTSRSSSLWLFCCLLAFFNRYVLMALMA